MFVFNASLSCINLLVVAVIVLYNTVFQSASLSCCNFIGHNLMFGKSSVRDYSSIPSDSVNLVRELRDNSLFVPGFHTSELNLFVHYVSTS